MPRTETHAMDQRMRLIVGIQNGETSMAELCRQLQMSRKTGYKWLARYATEGPAGLADRGRAPHTHPHQVPPETVEAILAVRDEHPLWGPKKLLKILLDQGGGPWPARSTIAWLLKLRGRVFDRKKRRRVPVQTQPLAHAVGPNAVWCCDFKGWFHTGEGRKCHPLTITDGFSRYLLRCQALPNTDLAAVQPIFEVAFREYGLPQAIRSDNGPPFASRAVGGLSRLSIWWIKLGVRPDRIEPGKPQQNGRHERMHLTLKQATADPPASTFARQQQRMDEFRREYNELRPHEALGMDTPGSRYERSVRAWPSRLAEPEYADGWDRRRVACDGDFSWRHQPVFISEVLEGETIGLEPLDERYRRAYFGPVFLGVLDTDGPRMLSGAGLRRLDRQRLAAGVQPASPPPASSAFAALRQTTPEEAEV